MTDHGMTYHGMTNHATPRYSLPPPHQARAASVASAVGRWWPDCKGIALHHCDIHPGEWRQLKEELRSNTLKHRAVDSGEVSLVVYVFPLTGWTLGAHRPPHSLLTI